MRLSDTADSFVFMGQLLRRQYDICLRQHDKGDDCYKDLVRCHGVLRNSVAAVLIATAHAVSSHLLGLRDF
jgi:hypothetical protein